ncbi:hypothetical protein A4X13_0g5902 [Tilletia indica]|uniref:Uncharacterized protein n=1 Tax=Tilletia indica TaxID=43049 RepID=A0A177T4K2_9BASI|nr:hypothetical protein A4X13_0g5902 [Tilletia indica]
MDEMHRRSTSVKRTPASITHGLLLMSFSTSTPFNLWTRSGFYNDEEFCVQSKLGHRCYTSDECSEGVCDSTKTYPLRDTGKACSASSKCSFQLRNPSTAICTLKNALASACTKTDDCTTGGCCNSVCSILPVDHPCSKAGFRSGVAPDNGCSANSDCASLQCDPTYITLCGSNGQGPCNTFQACNPVSTIGGVCSADGVCHKAAGSSTATCQVATITTPTSTPTSTITLSSTSTPTSTTFTASKPSATPLYASGLACNANSDFSGYCPHLLQANGTQASMRMCQDKKVLGEACYTSVIFPQSRADWVTDDAQAHASGRSLRLLQGERN